jgi:hypothetical protein
MKTFLVTLDDEGVDILNDGGSIEVVLHISPYDSWSVDPVSVQEVPQ